jgi:hypothetical protein
MFQNGINNNFLAKCWEYLAHPPFSLFLASSNFQFRGHLKKYFEGQHFQYNDEVETNVCWWVQTLSPYFLFVGIKHVVYCWEKYVQFVWQLHGEIEGLPAIPGYSEYTC